mgnify:FL=1
MAPATSRKPDLKLTNAAKASLEELRLDYKDFLRRAASRLWHKNDAHREELFENRCKIADDVAKWAREVYDRKPHGPQEKQKGPARRFAQALDFIGGAEGDRTPDLCIANAALSQLSYSPMRSSLNKSAWHRAKRDKA